MPDKIAATTDGVSMNRHPMGAGCEPFIDEEHLKEMREEVSYTYSYGTLILNYYKFSTQGSISPEDKNNPDYDPLSENNLVYEDPVEIQGYFEVVKSNEQLTEIGSTEDFTFLIHLDRNSMDELGVEPCVDDLVELAVQELGENNDYEKYVGTKLKIIGVNQTENWRGTVFWYELTAEPKDVNY